MNPIFRNILAVIAGVFAGGAVNMGLILLGASLLPPPVGVDVNDVASINAHIGEYSIAQLLSPFLAHALGALAGAFVAAKLAASRKQALAMVIGGVNLLGGIMAVQMIPAAPLWFVVLDLGFAYLPMAWLGGRLGARTA